ncbi:MAG: hypothetical protein JO276_15540 [Sphingomonadaceae bacterium]|nr:hypothetical protein [Sphingomonadaceae bacterium]
MSFSYSGFEARLKDGAPISADDVLALRRAVWPDGAVSEAEASALFDLNRAAKDVGPEWRVFFIEAITEYVVNQRAPRGYVDEAAARWLIGEIEQDGAAATPTDVELVVKILETALNGPETLKRWALGRIEAAVLTGEGPTRDGAPRPNVIDEAEVALLRRIVFAAGGEGACTVGADEAELLWRLKDACLDSDNAPGWKTLFVQALGNHLMAYNSYRPLAREEAARLDAFIGDHHSSVLGFFARMGRAGPAAGVRDLLHPDRETSAAAHDEAVRAAGAVTGSEQAWLDAHLDADHKRDSYEEALLAFIAEEQGR